MSTQVHVRDVPSSDYSHHTRDRSPAMYSSMSAHTAFPSSTSGSMSDDAILSPPERVNENEARVLMT